MNNRGERRSYSMTLAAALLAAGLLAAACSTVLPTSAPTPAETFGPNALASLAAAASPTAQAAPTETLASTEAPFVLDLTPLPSPTPLPTLEIPTEAARPPALEVWDGVPTYPAESNPAYYFRLSFDPTAWALTVDNFGMPALASRTDTSCILSPTVGRGLPPNAAAQHEVRRIGGVTYQVTVVDVNGVRQSVTYVGGDGRIYTAFQLSLPDSADQCTQAAEAVLGTLTSVPVSQATPVATP
jgi:hypothetical protein